MTYRTKHGAWTRDAANIWHYKADSGAYYETAAIDAMDTRPPRSACFFWFNESFVVIRDDMTAGELALEWWDNREGYWNSGNLLSRTFEALSIGKKSPPKN
jgi:hypothetical protein